METSLDPVVAEALEELEQQNVRYLRLAELLREWRARKGVRQVKAARAMGVATITIKSYEGGARTPSQHTLYYLFRYYDVPETEQSEVLGLLLDNRNYSWLRVIEEDQRLSAWRSRVETTDQHRDPGLGVREVIVPPKVFPAMRPRLRR